MDEREPRDRMPLPSEDEGDLVNEPASGETDDYLVAEEEGVDDVVDETSVSGDGG